MPEHKDNWSGPISRARSSLLAVKRFKKRALSWSMVRNFWLELANETIDDCDLKRRR